MGQSQASRTFSCQEAITGHYLHFLQALGLAFNQWFMTASRCSASFAAVLAHWRPGSIFLSFSANHTYHTTNSAPNVSSLHRRYHKRITKSQTERMSHLKEQLWLIHTSTSEELLISCFLFMAISNRFPIPLAVMKNNSFASLQSLGNTGCLTLSYNNDLRTTNAYSRDVFQGSAHRLLQLQHQSIRSALHKGTDCTGSLSVTDWVWLWVKSGLRSKFSSQISVAVWPREHFASQQ